MRGFRTSGAVTGSGPCMRARSDISDSSPDALRGRSLALLEEQVHVVGGDQVGYRPAVQVVLGHALLGEALEPLGVAAGLGHLQRRDPDGLGGARVVALVQLVPST